MKDLRITIELTSSRPTDLSDEKKDPQSEEVVAVSSMLAGLQNALLKEMMHSQD